VVEEGEGEDEILQMVVEVDPEGVVRTGEEVQEVAALQWDGVEVDLEEVKENVVIDLEVSAGVHLDPEMNIFPKRKGMELKSFLIIIITRKKMTVVSTVKTTNKAILR
jgi:hypothetical protein